MSANLSRRSFIAGSAAMGGMMLGVSSSAEAKVPSKWDFKADVIVVGAGAAGIPAAIRAVEQGLSVLVVDANYDIGGHAIISQGNTLLGGGNAMQQKYGIEDSPETIFEDLTDWSVTLPNGFADYRFNDRDMQAMIAKESVPTYDWLVKIGVPFLDKKPDNAGAYGAGCSAPRELHFSWTKGANLEAPAGTSGTVLMRSLEDAARKVGVKFLLNFYMDELIVDEKGRVVGLKAHRTPKVLPDGTELKSFRSDGNVESKKDKIVVGAKKAVVLATAGYTDNVTFRRMVDPRLTKEFASAACEYSPQDGSGTLAAIKVGAGLWGLTNAYTERPISLTRGAVIGVRDTYLRWAPESPIFPLVKHSGVALRNWQNAIVVNWVGKRFFEETSSAGLTADSGKLTSYGTANSTRGLMNGTNGAFFKELDKNPYVQGNWRNIDRTKYNPINFIAAALQGRMPRIGRLVLSGLFSTVKPSSANVCIRMKRVLIRNTSSKPIRLKSSQRRSTRIRTCRTRWIRRFWLKPLRSTTATSTPVLIRTLTNPSPSTRSRKGRSMRRGLPSRFTTATAVCM